MPCCEFPRCGGGGRAGSNSTSGWYNNFSDILTSRNAFGRGNRTFDGRLDNLAVSCRGWSGQEITCVQEQTGTVKEQIKQPIVLPSTPPLAATQYFLQRQKYKSH